MHYGMEAELLPNLITEVPSKENGGLNDDLTVVTYKLLPDVTWSDGEPFTAEDVRYGKRMAVFGLPCDEKWRTPAGIETVGPRYFGYDYDYQPVEELAKERG